MDEIMAKLGLSSRKTVRENYIKAAIAMDFVEPQYPDTPNHPHQKYRMTPTGKEYLDGANEKQD